MPKWVKSTCRPIRIEQRDLHTDAHTFVHVDRSGASTHVGLDIARLDRPTRFSRARKKVPVQLLLVQLTAASAINGQDLAGHISGVDREVNNGTGQVFERAEPLQRNRLVDLLSALVVGP